MINRNDSADAAKIAAELCPDVDARRAWAQFTVQSIEIARTTAPKSWAITLFADRVRLNVGQIAVLELWQGIVVFYCRAPVSLKSSKAVRRFRWKSYRAVKAPAERWGVELSVLPQTPQHLIDQHHELVRLAALAKRSTPFRHAHSPGVMAYLESFLDATVTVGERPLPEELRSAAYQEGATRRITVNAYERSDAARAACIERHGTSCSVCGLTFGALYGPVAEGYIHVHHLKALSEIGESYEVDPAGDLRPVCPNCHAVIHLGGETRSLEDVRRLLDVAKRANTDLQPTTAAAIMSRRG